MIVPERGYGEAYRFNVADDLGRPIQSDDNVIMVIKGTMAELGLRIENRSTVPSFAMMDGATQVDTRCVVHMDWINRNGQGPWFYLQRDVPGPVAVGPLEHAKELLHAMVESEDNPCQFDHNGNCQGHSDWSDEPYTCTVREARQFLGLPDAGVAQLGGAK